MSSSSRRSLLQGLGLLGLALATGTGVSGCAGSAAGGDEARADVDRAAIGPDHAAAAPMLAAVAGDLLREVLGRATGNLVFSPWSIAVAMGMNRAGAAGATARQIDQAMHFQPTPAGARDAALNTAALVLAGHNKSYALGERKGEVILRSANSTWAQPDVAWRSEYLAVLARYYGSGVRLTDFAADPDGSRDRINAWVAERTEGRIDDLVPEGAITALTRMVLVNAVYLQAPWAQDFDKQQTRDGAFTLADGTRRQVPMMHGAVAEASGFTGQDYQAVRLPYLGGTLAMTAVLPHQGRDAEVADWLAGAGIADIIGQAGRARVDVTMPRFSFASDVDLTAVLTALGITDAFDPDRADYSGMTGQERLFIAAALHQATIEVDEQGTVATAATAIVMDTTAAPADPQTIVLDRPFFFVIHDLEARVPIFVGRVADPTRH